MPIDKVWIYQLLFVCLCVCVYMVSHFYADDKAGGVKFCTAVHRRPRHGISHFGELCSQKLPQKPKIGRIDQRANIGCSWYWWNMSERRSIYSLVLVFCVCTVTDFSARIKLAASHFAWRRRFIGVQGRESPILVNVAPQKPKIGRIGQRMKDDECSLVGDSMTCPYQVCAACGRRIGMCGYTSVPEELS